MGVDNEAVLDLKSKVHGIENLRVVDGSVMPCIPSGTPHSTIVAIAERAAQFYCRRELKLNSPG